MYGYMSMIRDWKPKTPQKMVNLLWSVDAVSWMVIVLSSHLNVMCLTKVVFVTSYKCAFCLWDTLIDICLSLGLLLRFSEETYVTYENGLGHVNAEDKVILQKIEQR